MTAPHRSFADDVRSRTAAQLRDLVMARPDLIHPEPSSISALAARAATRSSIQRAVEALPADLLHTLEALMVSGGDLQRTAELLDAAPCEVESLADELWLRALLWRNGSALDTARSVSDVIRYPARLGPPLASLSHAADPAQLAEQMDGLTPAAREVLDHLATRHPVAVIDEGTAASAASELVDRGLAWRTDADHIVLPREVALLHRGGVLADGGISPPKVSADAADPAECDAHAGLAALDLLWQIETLAQAWDADPPRVMAKGGLSVRDHKNLATALATSLEHAAFVAELAHAAGLVAADSAIEPTWLPTPAYDDWCTQPPQQRWETLIEAWWTMLRAPSLAGTRNENGVVNLLGPGTTWPLMRARRHDVLQVLADLPTTTRATRDDVDDLLRWHRPLRLSNAAPTHSAVVLAEAQWLGLVADGRLSTAGRALVAGGLSSATLASILPATLEHVLIQADLTAIAPGPMSDGLRRLMTQTATLESHGGASTFRFSADSIQRALDAGLDPTHLREQLSTASSTGLPQALDYLLTDAARRHGVARVGSAGSYVRSDDEVGLQELLADPAAQALHLRALAPTVLVSRLAPARLLTLLRELGYSFLAEDAEGRSHVAGPEARRAPTPRPTAPVTQTAVTQQQAADLIDRLASAAEPDQSVGPDDDPAITQDILLDAAAGGLPVRISYVDSSGRVRRITLRPKQVEAGRVSGTVGDTDESRVLQLHRIVSATPA